jgi:threonine synthase
LGAPEQADSFSDPTGNFADNYAGYLPRAMGLPINQLIDATNKNDILHRFISRNEYSVTDLSHTYSPSMDILVSSNFERYLFDLFDRDTGLLVDFMSRLGKETLSVSAQHWQRMQDSFDSASVDDETTCEVIADVYQHHGILLDPHTAVGVKAARDCNKESSVPMVTLATAHPAKFSDAITAAGIPSPPLPAHLADLFDREERCTVLGNDLQAVTDFLRSHIGT